MQSVDEFEKIVNYIVGVYYDSTIGFTRSRRWLEKIQENGLPALRKKNPNLTDIKQLDSALFQYGYPDKPGKPVEHQCTQKEYKDRNTDNGLNFQFLGNMALISLYQYWEDFHREQIAKELGMKKNDLKVTIMGDLCQIRNSIIHHAGVANKKIKKCELLKWYQEGDEIFIDKTKFKAITDHVRIVLGDIRTRKDNLHQG